MDAVYVAEHTYETGDYYYGGIEKDILFYAGSFEKAEAELIRRVPDLICVYEGSMHRQYMTKEDAEAQTPVLDEYYEGEDITAKACDTYVVTRHEVI